MIQNFQNLRNFQNFRDLATRSLALAAAFLAVAACQRTPHAGSQASSAAAPSTPASTAPVQPAAPSAIASNAAPSAAPSEAAPAAATPVKVCTLLSAAEVGAVMGKTLIQDGCSYGLDPAEKERALAESQKHLQEGRQRATAGDMNGLMKGMMNGLGPQSAASSAMMNQMTITVDAARDNQTEDEIKAIYAKTGGIVRGTLAPEKHGVQGVIQGLDEVSGVGDWAFATNVAAVNMGMGFSIRGRILEARKGPWHVTVSATVAPDPGAAALDNRLAGVARALIAKL